MPQDSQEQQLKDDGYWFWLQNYKSRFLDEKIHPFLKANVSSVSWLRDARNALFLSTGTMASRLGITRAGYARMEKSEEAGSISLKKLKAAAKAMDCELVYFLRPKSKKRFSVLIWEKLAEAAKGHGWVKSRPEKLKSRALAAIGRIKMNDAQFRTNQNWSERK